MDPSSETSRQMASLLNLKQNLLKSQLNFTADHGYIYEQISKLTGCNFTNQTIKFESYTQDFLLEIAKQNTISSICIKSHQKDLLQLSKKGNSCLLASFSTVLQDQRYQVTKESQGRHMHPNYCIQLIINSLLFNLKTRSQRQGRSLLCKILNEIIQSVPATASLKGYIYFIYVQFMAFKTFGLTCLYLAEEVFQQIVQIFDLFVEYSWGFSSSFSLKRL